LTTPTLLIVFVHGLFGWGDERNIALWPKEYWYGVQRFVQKEFGSRPNIDLNILAPSLPSLEGIEVRGAHLKAAVLNSLRNYLPGTRAHLIAHSRGGLDGRWLIAQPGMADKIASLTTIGTAHRGTTFMNLTYALLPLFRFSGKLLKLRETLKRRLGMRSSEFYYHFLQSYDCSAEQMRQAFYPLTIKGAADFNDAYAECERAIRQRIAHRVTYRAYAGHVSHVRMPFLRLSHSIIAWLGTSEERRSGNDGASSVWSAHYPWEADHQPDGMDPYIRNVPFDHYEQVNWAMPGDSLDNPLPSGLQAMYREIIQHIWRINERES
jgi:triacylglycerol esterase/lipase EstA (alpha/beta hydrolase family)